jgi:hypothetical protein
MSLDDANQTFSNSISDSFGDTAGISVIAQNAGQNSLIQQNVNVQANLTLE